MTYTAAQMMEIALDQLGRMTMERLTKECKTCSKLNGFPWTLTPSDAVHHQDRHGYEKHVIVDSEREEKKRGARK